MKRAKKSLKKERKIHYKIFFCSLFIFIAAFFTVIFISGLFGGNGSEKNPLNDVQNQRINLLITGLDQDGLRTDLILIASYNTSSKKTDILLIPENTRMYVGGRYQKISAAHAIYKNGKPKGISGTIEALNRLTAIPLNYYMEFSEDAFRQIIDAFGGVDFNVPRNMKYSDPLQDLYINLKKGRQNLDGNKSCQLLKFASYEGGVQERTLTQKNFFEELARQKLNPEYISMLPGLYSELDIKTNLNTEDIIKYSNIILGLCGDDINFCTLPGYQEQNSVTYWIPDMDALKNIIKNTFGYDPVNITTDKTR